MGTQIEHTLTLALEEAHDLTRDNEAKISHLEKECSTRIVLRGDQLKIIGEPAHVKRTVVRIEELLELQRRGGNLSSREFQQALRHQTREQTGVPREDRPLDQPLSELFLDGIPVPLKRRRLCPLTAGQKRYIETIRKKDIVFGIGPAGTGKTYLAVAMAVSALMQGKVARIVLCRPAVEAGERLGFLPGDLKEKLDPYVRPLYDALYEMMEAEKIHHALENGVIEIAPLAFMRGRTLNNAFIILDEGQNTTPEQMKMFLTRLGFESKVVVTGDQTQVDLPSGYKASGLCQVQKVLGDLKDVAFVHFDERDVVRHELVMKIVKAYEKFEQLQADRQTTHHPPAAARP